MRAILLCRQGAGDLPAMMSQKLFSEAVTLHQQGRLQEAEALYRQVLALAPAAVDAWANRGAALQGLGRLPEALDSYERAIKYGLATIRRISSVTTKSSANI